MLNLGEKNLIGAEVESVRHSDDVLANGKIKGAMIDWESNFPKHWEIIRVKDIARISSGKFLSSDELSSDESKYPVYGANGIRGYTNDFNILPKWHFLVGRVGSVGAIQDLTGRAWVTDNALIVSSKNKRYLMYWFCAFPLNVLSSTTAQPLLTGTLLKNACVAHPPLPEQIVIAEFLDKSTAFIDQRRALIERKKALLQEHKRALIHEAVTKGLNPGVPMKPSGVDWIGEVPSHWNMRRLKDILYERGEKNIMDDGRAVTDNILSVMKDRGVINYRDKGNVGNKMSDDITGYKVVHKGDLVVNKMNVLIGSFGISLENGALSVVYLVLRNIVGHMPYFGCVFSDKGFQLGLRRIATGILEIREAVNMDLFWQEVVPFPPEAEQVDIAKHLAEIGELISRQDQMLQNKLDLLAHLRSSVIHEAVTKGLPATASAC